jgi:hypothetical protein
MLDQPVEADQERVARKRRQRLVGGVAVAGRAERQDLPDGLAVRCKPVHKAEGPVTKVADAIAPRQGGGVKQNTAAAREEVHTECPL